MKNFNKLLMLAITVILVTFIDIEKVYANECDGSEYACAICEYPLQAKNNAKYGTIKYIVKSDGSKVFKTLTPKFENETHKVGEDNLSAINFVNKSTNKIECPSSLSLGIYPGENYRTTFDFYLKDCDSSKSQYYACNTVKLLNEENNNLTISSNNEDIISCQYETSIINGQGSSTKITGYINVTNGIVEYEFTDGYEANNNIEKIPADKFTKDSCPSLYFSCASYNGYKTCSFELENVIRPGTEQEGEQTETTDKKDEEEKDDYKYVCSQKPVCGLFCPDEGGTWSYIQMFYNLIRMAIPAVVIILGMIDFMSVVFSGEDKDMKSAGQRFLKRVIIGIVFILLPIILDFLIELIGFSENCLDQLIK